MTLTSEEGLRPFADPDFAVTPEDPWAGSALVFEEAEGRSDQRWRPGTRAGRG